MVAKGAAPRVLVLSHVLPFPASTGQCQRVRYTLQALRRRFHITFATSAPAAQLERTKLELLNHCDAALVWKSKHDVSRPRKAVRKAAAVAYALATGLRTSHYEIGKVEFSPSTILENGLDRGFDLVLLEYWHAAGSMKVFQQNGIPCIVDLHNILWQARAKELTDAGFPRLFAQTWAKRYKAREEKAWQGLDALITINKGEDQYIRSAFSSMRLFYAPMGIPLESWPYSWQPQSPPRLVYYGGLGSSHNRSDALRCLRKVMPIIWREVPKAEFWIVGSNPPAEFRQLESDSRVKVTGFVPQPREVLGSATAVLCPWSGTYGFRSRLVEVMALGVPVVASTDAAYGMGLREGEGFFACSSDQEMAERALGLIKDADFAKSQSGLARRQIQDLYSFEASYGRLANELYEWLHERGAVERPRAQAIAG